MLEIQVKESKWRRNFFIVIVSMLILAGGYILLIAFAPSLNSSILTGRDSNETEAKLKEPVGSYGDRLYIPKINVDQAIVVGSDPSILEKGAWHRKPENGDPIKGGNFVLSAHRFVMSYTPRGTAEKSPFYNIHMLSTGDRLYVDYQNKRYEYEVAEKYEVSPVATEVEAKTVDARLTLYSCTLQGSSDGRDVVVARPILSN